ncbi:MAG: MFS transporter [Candidatus Micrarchaeaceae archaeon]
MLQDGAKTKAYSIEKLPMGRFVWWVTILSSMGMFMDGYVLTIFSAATILPIGLKSVFQPTSLEWGLMGAASLLGMFVGAATFGNLADRIGRKRLYVYDLSMTALFLFLTVFSTSWLMFFIFQFIAGIGVGADYPISSSLQAEFSPKAKRGALLVLNIFMWTVGSIAFLLLSIPLYYAGAAGWKIMYGTAAIIPLFVIISRNTLPESPRWLMLKGMKEELARAVKQVSQAVGAMPSRLMEGVRLEKGKTSFRELFSKRFILLTLFTTIAWFSYDVSSYGVWTFTPSIFVSAGGTYVSSIVADLLEEVPVFIGFALCIALVERVGRKPLEEYGFLLAGITLVLFAAYAHFTAKPIFFVAFFGFAFMHIFHNLGPTNLTYAYPAEAYPTRLRGTAHGFATTVSRLGGVLGIVAFPVLLSSLSLSAALLMFAAFEFIGFTVTRLWAPETKGSALR